MTDLKLKKLVYLYLMNYAMALPDLAIMAFVNDCEDPIPRFGGEYLCDPLRKFYR